MDSCDPSYGRSFSCIGQVGKTRMDGTYKATISDLVKHVQYRRVLYFPDAAPDAWAASCSAMFTKYRALRGTNSIISR
jgi:hypothetical protein